jgi:hypothetical protein
MKDPHRQQEWIQIESGLVMLEQLIKRPYKSSESKWLKNNRTQQRFL